MRNKPGRHALLVLGTLALLSGCSARIIPEGSGTQQVQRPATAPPPPAARPVPATPRPALPVSPPPAFATVDAANTAVGAGLIAGPDIATLLPASDDRARRALAAFRRTCPGLLRRNDQSLLTSGSDWQQACSAAASWPDATAAEFFTRFFEAVQIGDGRAFVTGYFEPEIAGSRTRAPGFTVPVYRRPTDLVDVDLGAFSDELKGKRIRGRVQGTNFIPYADRAEIEGGALAGRNLEIAWAADAVDLFFLQIQGSGRLRAPDGTIMRIGYDGQNGRDYVGIGKLMKDRGLIQAGSMQDIVSYLRANPVEGAAIMNENKSYIFFRELTGDGAVGAMGVTVTGETSVAVDPRYVPLGAPVILSLDRAEPNGLWIAQDTGGAIKGANRFDTFWGAGERAKAIAGGMSARGSALILLPRGSYARLASRSPSSRDVAAPAP